MMDLFIHLILFHYVDFLKKIWFIIHTIVIHFLILFSHSLKKELYTIKFINLETGKKIGKSITNTSGGVSWADDNETVFYDKKNIETLRNEKVFKYNLNNDKQLEVFFEEDETFNLNSYKTKSGKYIVISI